MPEPTASPSPPLKDWIQRISFLTSAAQSADLPLIGPGEIAIAANVSSNLVTCAVIPSCKHFSFTFCASGGKGMKMAGFL